MVCWESQVIQLGQAKRETYLLSQNVVSSCIMQSVDKIRSFGNITVPISFKTFQWWEQGKQFPEITGKSMEYFLQRKLLRCIKIDLHIFVLTYYLPSWVINPAFEQAPQMSSVSTCLHRGDLYEEASLLIHMW